MASSFIACYLFFAGAGAAAFFIGAVVDLLLRVRRSDKLMDISRVTDAGLFLGPVSVAVACVFLLCDLGSPRGVINVFLNPPSSVLSWGAWSVAVFLLFSLLAFLAGRSRFAAVFRVVEPVCQVVALLSAIFIMAYSGVYLSLFPAVPFLRTAFIPMLFIVSALSVGMGFLIVVGFIRSNIDGVEEGIARLAPIDACLVALEALLLFAFCIDASLADEAVRVSFVALVSGPYAFLFWLGVVFAGIVVPLLADIAQTNNVSLTAAAVGGACAVLGGLSLRFVLLLVAVRYEMVGMAAQAFWM